MFFTDVSRVSDLLQMVIIQTVMRSEPGHSREPFMTWHGQRDAAAKVLLLSGVCVTFSFRFVSLESLQESFQVLAVNGFDQSMSTL